jgi:hypothetical protein
LRSILHNVQPANGIYSGGKLSEIFSNLGKYLSYAKTRKGASVACFVACGILIFTFVEIPVEGNDKQMSYYSLLNQRDTTIVRGICISYIVFLGVINYSTPYITATQKIFKCLNCEADMQVGDLVCQNCGSTFHFKL